MLSELQQRDVWERWLAAEMRANYFGDMATRYSHRQSMLTWLTLLSSSGAAFAIVTDWLPAHLSWIKPALAFLTAGLSLLSLVFQNQKRSFDCSELHFKWNRLASEYEALWNDMYAEDALPRLSKLTEKGAELSKTSTAIPYHRRVMVKWEDHVLQHRAPQHSSHATA
jgi:hypothetical protein